jgi:hypothetical protein
VRRIRYDSAPLAAMLRERAKGQEVPSMRTEEVYKVVIVNEPIPPTTFNTDLPKGVQSVPMKPAVPTVPPAAARRAPAAAS